MTKNIWVLGTFVSGIILCVFGNSAFAAIGVLLGIISICGGIYFLCGFSRRGNSIIAGAGLILVGLILIILSIFIEPVAFFLGGIILLAAGIILLPLFGRRDRLVIPFCIGCMLSGAVILFMPSFIGWISVAVGIGLLIFSGLALLYMY